ncbi:Hypothetical protein CINCED_3A013394 [Cinara cedri]|uniref:Uncharacterized protein n=1 Tax=Cinara cedri TaxID=506608 RepID=A0A5E4MA34_9HEMI|nr:Hypothetical protein CINCED_3A013394 [Cinara cedri]
MNTGVCTAGKLIINGGGLAAAAAAQRSARTDATERAKLRERAYARALPVAAADADDGDDDDDERFYALSAAASVFAGGTTISRRNARVVCGKQDDFARAVTTEIHPSRVRSHRRPDENHYCASVVQPSRDGNVAGLANGHVTWRLRWLRWLGWPRLR